MPALLAAPLSEDPQPDGSLALELELDGSHVLVGVAEAAATSVSRLRSLAELDEVPALDADADPSLDFMMATRSPPLVTIDTTSQPWDALSLSFDTNPSSSNDDEETDAYSGMCGQYPLRMSVETPARC